MKMSALALAVLAAAAAPVAAESVKLKNGGTIHYTVDGAGQRAAVLIHGYSFSSAAWAKMKGKLPPGWRGIAYDLRGYGQSDKPAAGYTYEQMTEDLLQFMDALKLRRVALIGHSMGGMLAQDFAAAHPDRVAALVLVAAQARNKPPIGMTPAFQQRIDAYGTPEQNRAVFLQATPRYFKPGNVAEAEMQRMIEINMQAATPALKEGFRTVLTAPALPAEKWARLKMPTLIVVPTHDIVPFTVPAGLAETVPGATIAVVENSGHTPMIEKPERFAQHVAAFLRSVR